MPPIISKIIIGIPNTNKSKAMSPNPVPIDILDAERPIDHKATPTKRRIIPKIKNITKLMLPLLEISFTSFVNAKFGRYTV
ncbi:MAG: hypothetical protein ACW98D_17060 [Promethearchaeota archaeon]|jgi:hypothetical protein